MILNNKPVLVDAEDPGSSLKMNTYYYNTTSGASDNKPLNIYYGSTLQNIYSNSISIGTGKPYSLQEFIINRPL